MRKRFSAFFLSVVLCMGLAVYAFAADAASGACGESATWSFDGATGTLTISGTGSIGGDGDMRYGPSYPWKDFKQEIKAVVIGEGVTDIGVSAFEGCASLTQVSIPQSVSWVGSAAFSGTPWLEGLGEFAIINGILIKYQGSGEKVTIPDGVTSVNTGAFMGNKTITEVIIPEGVTSLGASAFSNCDNLAQVAFPGTLREVEAGCFFNTRWLEIQRAAGDFILAGPVLLKYQGEGGSVVIPDGVAYVEEAAFTWSSWFPFGEDLELESLVVPASMRDLNAELAFFGASIPESLIYKGSREQWNAVENTAFYDGVEVPVTCEDGEGPAPVPTPTPSAITMAVTNPDGSAPQTGGMELTLRNITEEYFPDNRHSAVHTDFTRNEGTETVKLDSVATLAPGSAIQIDGIQTTGDGRKPWERVSLSAWSDPDGDGVFDQQLFYFYWNWNWDSDESSRDTAVAFTVPLSQPGPFSYWEINYGDGRPIYSRSISILSGSGRFAHRPYSYFGIPASITLDGGDLTGLLGPNTLIELQASTATDPRNSTCKDLVSPPFYAFIPADAAAVPEFTDLPGWCAGAVRWAAVQGIAKGTGGGRFSPSSDCTHAQILTFLWRAAGRPAAAKSPLAVPVAYADAVDWAYEKGMVDDSFDSRAACTRADAVRYIWQAFGTPGDGTGSGFADVPAGADCAAAVSWAVGNGITNGFPGDIFLPNKTCRRGEIVTLLHRACVPSVRLK